MDSKTQKFVSRILVFHGLLLLGVLALLALASGAFYDSSREYAITQAHLRQNLLADQICRGIYTFYSGIISDLGWIQHRPLVQNRVYAPGGRGRGGPLVNPAARGGAPPNANPGRRAARDKIDATTVGEQLDKRVSALFTFDKKSGAVAVIVPEKSTLTAEQFPPAMQAWLKAVDNVKVSSSTMLNDQAVSLVAATFGVEDPNLLLVAVVPGSEIESTFSPLLNANDENSASATVADAQLQVLASSNPSFLGNNLAGFDNPDFHVWLGSYETNPQSVTELFTQPLNANSTQTGGRLVTLEPVTVGSDQWTVLFAYPLARIDSEVNGVFKRALGWAALVAISIAAILVFTAARMIRLDSRLERERHQVLTRELTQARRIQEQWLPDLASAPPQMDVAAVNLPASHISGDFYNWFELPDAREVVIIGDVTGHGMAAAFLMATTQLIVRNAMMTLGDPGAAMEEVNRQLTQQVFHGQFVTMLILAIDFDRKTLDVASAGHPAPLIARNGAARKLELEAQLVLGVEKNVDYPTQHFDLPDLSSLFLYTDGVADARGPRDERFGVARLITSLAHHLDNPREMIDAAAAAVQRFCDGTELDDDLTMVAIQVRQTPSPRATELSSRG